MEDFNYSVKLTNVDENGSQFSTNFQIENILTRKITQ